MAARAEDKGHREPALHRQELTFALAGLSAPSAVTIDLSRAARSALVATRTLPVVQVEAGPGGGSATLSGLRIQPQRVQFEVLAAPPVLTVTLQVACDGPFVFGWLHVPEETRSTVTTSVESLRTVGPGYWAVPVWEPAGPQGDGYAARGEDMQTITHQPLVAALGRDGGMRTETARSREKPSS